MTAHHELRPPSFIEVPPVSNGDSVGSLEQISSIPSYELYRGYCDSMSGNFRRIGLLSPEGYVSAVQDARTVWGMVDNLHMPVLAAIEHEPRYDVQRCRKLTDMPEVLLLTIPLSRFADTRLDKLESGLRPDTAIVVEEFELSDTQEQAKIHQNFLQAIQQLGPYEEHQFVHELLKSQPEHSTAWMAVYSFSFGPSREANDVKPVTPQEAICEQWQKRCEERDIAPVPNETSNGAYLFTSEQLRQNPHIVDDLWGISKIGFGKTLGEYHPISMQVTKEFFVEHITSPDVLVSVRYLEGEPVGFGFIGLNMEHNDWMDVAAPNLREDLARAEERGEQLIHFFELISNGARGLGLSADILQLFMDLCGKTGRKYHVIFESTNLSATYILPIAQHHLEKNPYVKQLDPIRMIGKLAYLYLTQSYPPAASQATEIS